MNLRFVIRDGEKILQYETKEYEGVPYYDALGRRKHNSSVWVDIPLCDEFTGQEIKE